MTCASLALMAALGSGRAAYAQDTAERLGESWRWVHFTTDSGLPSDRVYDIIEEPNGTIWAHTSQGVAWYDGFRWRAPSPLRFKVLTVDARGGLLGLHRKQLYQISQEGIREVPLVDEGRALAVVSVAALDAQALILAADAGLFRYERGALTPLPLPDEVEAWTDDNATVQRTRSGAVWLNIFQGLFRWADGQWTRWPFPGMQMLREDEAGGMLYTESVPAIEGLWTWQAGIPPARFEDAASTAPVRAMDLGARGEGLIVFGNGRVLQRQGGTWHRLDETPTVLQRAHFVRYVASGDVFVGAEQGFYLFRASASRWKHWGDAVAKRERLHAILKTRTGAVWIGTPKGLTIFHPDGRIERVNRVLDTDIVTVTGLAEDAEGGVWVSSGGAFSGVFRWHNNTWRHYGVADGLTAPRVHRIVPGRKGQLWFAGLTGLPIRSRADAGLFLYNGDGFQRWPPKGVLPHSRVYAFAEGPNGERCVGTLGGLSCWDRKTWRHWTEAEGLGSDKVFTLAIDRQGRVWFGHQREGLGYLDEQGQPRYLTQQDGLADDRVWDLQEGADGALWIATAGGLSRYQDGRFSTFRQASGLPFSRLWPVFPHSRSVLVGTVSNGLYELSLDEAGNPPPSVEIAPALVDADNVYLRWNAAAYGGELPADQIQTRYRLGDRPWSAWSLSREVTLPGIAPGRHTFTVQAKGLFGNVDPAGTAIAFRIAPPFYRHPLFVGAVLVWLVSLVGAAFSYWNNQRQYVAEIEARNDEIEAKNQELEARNAELERFAYTVSHDLKTPLVTIKGFLGLLKRDAAHGKAERMARDIEQIASAADTMNGLLDDLLDLSRSGHQMAPPESVALPDLARQAAELVAGPIQARGVLVEIDLAMPMVWGDRVRLLEVYQNLVGNAVKFMGDQAVPRVEIGARANGQMVHCWVRDNGIGIPERYQEKVFGLFDQLKPDAEGSGIGLALVRRIVEGHGGRIWVESEGAAQGSTFYFTLPQRPGVSPGGHPCSA